jgi:Na+/citrate or Na+/malate symporter
MANASTPPPHPAATALTGRWMVAVILSALIGGVTFLTVVGWAEGRGLTDLAFNHSLGVLIGGEGTRTPRSA